METSAVMLKLLFNSKCQAPQFGSNPSKESQMRKNILSVVVGAAMSALAGSASAGHIVIDIVDNGTSTGVSCSTLNAGTQAACLLAGFSFGAGNNLNQVSFTGNIGAYTASFTNTTTNNPGTAGNATLSLSFLDVRNLGSSGSLSYNVYAFGFTLPAGPDLTLFASQGVSANVMEGSAGSSFTSAYSVNPNNVTPPGDGASTSTSYTYAQGLTANPWSDGENLAGVNWSRNAGPFSMSDQMTFHMAAASDPGAGNGVNGSSNMVVRNRIPEPVSTALVGMGLVGLAFFSRRRKATQA